MSSTWKIDPAHSEFEFKARHLMISSVKGNFKQFDAVLEIENDDFLTAAGTFTAQVDSIRTGDESRDGHLKSDDFFNAVQYPQLSFKSTKMEKTEDDDRYALYGDFTIRDITKPIKLDVDFGGIVKDPWGNTKVGFELSGKVNRKEFGLNWNALTEAGGLVVGDEIKLHCAVEMTKVA